MRRDQTSGPSPLSGSGFPSPVNVSRSTASTRRSTRWATRPSLSTQWAKSSRKLGSKTASRTELSEGHRFAFSLAGAAQRRQQSLRVAWRMQQMGGLGEAVVFVGGQQHKVVAIAAANAD